MYENDIYSGTSTGSDTTGVYSGTNNNTINDAAQTHYSTYQTTGATTFEEVKTNNASNGNYENSNNSQKEPKKGGLMRKIALSVSMGLFFGMFAGLGFFAVQEATNKMLPQESQENVTLVNSDNVAVESESGIKLTNANTISVIESDVSDMVEEVMPAMVSIVNNYLQEGYTFFGQTYSEEQASSGSGIIVAESDSELLIVTNHHVVADATKLEVSFIDGSIAEAQIKGMDSDMDLAVIAISLDSLTEETKNAISIATLGDSDNLKLGEPVVAIGNALGYGQSVTNGIVSALDREITMDDGSTGRFIQTNAAINPGNSGGALLNIRGEVIGINSNKIGGTAIEGMGYAIPITSASPIIADLMERQTRTKVEEGEAGYMGISLQVVDEQVAMMYNMPQGIYVVDVESGSAADKAGLLKKDIITKFDGEKITSYDDLQNILNYYAAGTSATLTVQRQEAGEYVEYELEITLGRRPTSNQ